MVGLFCTEVCGYKFHARTVYVHSTFTVPPIGGAFGVQSSICLFAEIVNVLRPLAIFAEELHHVIFGRLFDRVLNGTLSITYYSSKNF